MSDQQDFGQNDARFVDKLSNMTEKAARAFKHKLHPMIERYAALFEEGARTPVLRRPSDYGMDYEDCFFPSLDGVPLEAWFIPANSDRLLIVNHPIACNRYGFPGHLPPWNTMFGGFEVNFLPELKHLHDAGYNILTYDLRNCGLSGDGNGGTGGMGLLESRDVVGALRYAHGRRDLSDMGIGLYGRCIGGNAAVVAMEKWPREFAQVQTLVLLNVVSGRSFIEKGAENYRLSARNAADRFDTRLRGKTGFRLDELTPLPHAHAVKVPTLMAQLRRDLLIHGERDGKAIFEALGAEEKELLWIEESNQRYYAYNHFGRHPERLISWFDRHMAPVPEVPDHDTVVIDHAL